MSYGSCRRMFAISSMLAGSCPPLMPKSANDTSAVNMSAITTHQTVVFIAIAPRDLEVAARGGQFPFSVASARPLARRGSNSRNRMERQDDERKLDHPSTASALSGQHQ